MEPKEPGRQMAARVTYTEKAAVIELVKKGRFINEADFVRTAIRGLLDELKEEA